MDPLVAHSLAVPNRVAYGTHPSQFFELYPAKSLPNGMMRGAVVMIHGGFWRERHDLAHVQDFCAALAESGFTVANLEYRRVGNGGGWPATFDDVHSGLAAARDRIGVDPVAVGHSAGGQLALRLADDPAGVAGVVALAAVTDLPRAADLHLGNDAVIEFLGGTPSQIPDTYAAADPRNHPASLRRILIHGTDDDVVPMALSRAFCQARRSDPGGIELIELSGASHFDLIDPSSGAWPAVLTGVLSLV